MRRKNVTRKKLVRIIKRRDIQSLLAIQEDQFDWEVLKQSPGLKIDCIDEIDEYSILLEVIIDMGYVFKKEENLKRVMDNKGQTVAHIMAWRGREFDPKKEKHILCLADNKGRTVAHVMAQYGYKFDPDKDADILGLADNNGWTVAHEMAYQGYMFDPDRHGEICELKDKEGYGVLECLILNNYNAILFGHMDQDLMRLSLESIEKYMEAAEKLNRRNVNRMDVYEYLKEIFKIKKRREEVEKVLGSLGLKL